MTEKGAVTRSRLLIQKADRADNGIYSCDPTTAAAATIHVHILNGTCLYTQSHQLQSVVSTHIELARKIFHEKRNACKRFVCKSSLTDVYLNQQLEPSLFWHLLCETNQQCN